MLLEIKKLSVRVKSSGLKAVDGIDLSVDAGEPLLILGQSGSGKTMICRALFGLTDRYDFDVSGQIVFEGEDILSADAKKRRKLYGSDIALIPQNPMTAFDPSCKIGNQLAETYRLHNKSSAKAKGRIGRLQSGVVKLSIHAFRRNAAKGSCGGSDYEPSQADHCR